MNLSDIEGAKHHDHFECSCTTLDTQQKREQRKEGRNDVETRVQAVAISDNPHGQRYRAKAGHPSAREQNEQRGGIERREPKGRTNGVSCHGGTIVTSRAGASGRIGIRFRMLRLRA